jgi:segregation and condensation protein A
MSVTVKLNQFEGPLDLLLQLIEERQMDITSVSLAAVTEQFLDYVRSLEEKNPHGLADFLVIAAKLLVIKSKTLLPNLQLDTEEEESAFDLAEQLLLYKKFKEVAKYIRRLDSRRRQGWGHELDLSQRVAFMPDPELNTDVLAGCLRRLANELKEIVKLPQKIMAEVVSITEKIEHIQKLISTKIQTSLSDLIKDSKSKTDVIVTFLALLELTKQRILTVEQTGMFKDIVIKKNHAT